MNLAVGIEIPAKRTRGVVFIALLWVLQSVLRLFGYLAVTGFPLLDVAVPRATLQVIDTMLFLFEVGGFIVVFWLWQMKRWGFWGTAIVSVATIFFDLWGLTIQSTAAAGLVVPVVSITYLYAKKAQLLPT